MERSSSGFRQQRLEHILLGEIRSILSDEVGDPDLAGITVREISLARDGSFARVVVTRAGIERSADRARTEVALRRVAPFVRRRLGEAVDLKRSPELRFVLREHVFDGDITVEDEREVDGEGT
jgi:ribosome-binding factor A